jgi:GTP cyclohydrolase I
MNLAEWLRSVIDEPEALKEIEHSEDRIRRAYRELLAGYACDPDSILNETVRVTKYDGVVEVGNIEFISLCAHHFLPFFGTADVRYVPNKIITGIGKIPRLVDAFARRCQIQELLTRDVALAIERCIGAKGVEVQTSALHLCMHGRGPRSVRAATTCTYRTGCLKAGERGKDESRPSRRSHTSRR